jgi:hypothetical protein
MPATNKAPMHTNMILFEYSDNFSKNELTYTVYHSLENPVKHMTPLIRRFGDRPEPNIPWLLAAISALSGLAWLMNTQNPQNSLYVGLFFFLLFATSYSVTFFLTNIVRRSILMGSGVFGFFLLRFFGLREPLYIILLASLLISLELYLQKR